VGPLSVVITPYKWPKINGFAWGGKNLTCIGVITPFITRSGAHLVGEDECEREPLKTEPSRDV